MSKAATFARLRPLWPLLLLFGLGTLFYARALGTGYLSDDFAWLRLVGPDAPLFAPITIAGSGAYFRPAITASLRLTNFLAPADALIAQHGINLLIHLGSAVLLFAIARRLATPAPAALLLAFIFLLHPIAVPNVYWLASRVDSLMALFFLLALWAGLKLLGSGLWRWGGLALLSGALALLSKEMALSLAPAWLILLAWQGRDPISCGAERRAGWHLAGLFALLSLIFIIGLYAAIYRPQAAAAGLIPSPAQAAATLAGGSAMLLLPLSQSLLLSWNQAYPWLAPLAGAGALLALVGLLVVTGRRRGRDGQRDLLLALALPFVGLLPLLATGPVARRLYLPLALALLALARLRSLAPARPAYDRLLLLLLLPLAAWSWANGSDWVQNDALARSLCTDIRPLADPAGPVVLLTYPSHFADAPVLANDAAAALYYCQTGRAGIWPDLLPLAALEARAAGVGAGSSRVEPAGPDQYNVFADAGAFRVGWDVAAGDSFSSGPVQVTILSLAQPGLATAFQVAFLDESWRSERTILFFDGATWQVVPSPQP